MCLESDLRRDGARVHVEVAGRAISLVRHRDTLYAIDAVCFHAGGPLTLGDIEDVNGRPCVSCPWHKYLIDLSSGDKLYEALEMDPSTRKLSPAGWKSMPQLQRTHRVQSGSDGQIYVFLQQDDREVRSDAYAYDKRTAAAAFPTLRVIETRGALLSPP